MSHTTGDADRPTTGRPEIDWQAELARHDRWLRTIAYARLGEADAVEEIMQEVALAAVRQASPLLDPSKTAPWLYQLTVRQVLQYRRKMGRRRKLTAHYAQTKQPTEVDEAHLDPLNYLLARERQQLIQQAVQQLPEQDAEILLLKYTENWSYHELAAHLGISHSAVESRLHRARRKLRQALAVREVVHAGVMP